MPKNMSCGYSVTHVTCGTIKFVLEPLGHLYYALQRMTFSGTASLVLRWTLCEVVKDISFPTCQLLSPDSVRKSYPRGGKLTFSRCLGVGNLTLASIKMSNSPGSELRRNKRAEIGRRHVMAHYAAALVRFCCHLAHPDQRRNISDTPWNRDPRPLLLTKNVTGSCTSPSNWCVRMKETRPTDRIRLICTYVKNVFVGIIQICDNDNLQQGLNIQFLQNPAH